MCGLAQVVLVEDDRDTKDLILRAFRRVGRDEIVHAEDGAAGIDILGRLAAIPDLVLLDLKLPSIDGFEVLRRIRATDRLRNVPVVIFSSDDDPASRERGLALGASEYMVKPVDSTQLNQVIATMAARYLTALAS